MQVMVLGMHRSGTSVVARLLNMMGMYFAPEGQALPPTADNPKGYWERNDVVLLNEGILANLGCTWERVSKFDLANISNDLHKEFNNQAGNIIYNLDANRPWMLKDPRLCLTLPLWRELLEVPVCILVYRSPIQIAQSMQNRDKFAINFGLALWEFYTLHALKASQDLPRILVCYQDLITKPVETTAKLYEQLQQFDITGIRHPSDKEIRAFIDTQLFRATAGEDLQHAYINHYQAELVQQFENAKILEIQDLAPLSQGSFDVLQAHDALFFEREEQRVQQEQLTLQHQQQLAQHQQELAQQRQQYAELEQQLAQLRTNIVQRDQQLEHKQQQLIELERQKLTLTNQLQQAQQLQYQLEAEANAKANAYAASLAQAQQQIQQKEQEQAKIIADLQHTTQLQYNDLHKLVHWLEVLQHDINAVFNSQTWKIGDNITKLILRLSFRAAGKTARDHIKQVLDSFMSWRIKQLQIDNNEPNSPETKKKLKLAALVALHNGEPSASASIRLLLPLQHPTVKSLVELEYYTAWQYLLNIHADVFIIQRHMLPNQEAAQRLWNYCQQQQIKLAYEIDDDLYHILPRVESQAIEFITKHADVVITSAPKLQEYVQRLNNNTVCVANSLDEQLWLQKNSAGNYLQPQPASTDGIIRILYMGTKTHGEDLMLVKAAYQKLKSEYGDKICLEVIGGVPDGSQIFADVLISGVNQTNLDDYASFVKWLREQNRWQFGIIPLKLTDFNRKKTYIKFLDYAALGVAAICSDIDPYNEIVIDGENGLIVNNTTQAWYSAMCQLIEQPELRQKLAANAFNTLIKQHILQHNASQFLLPYQKLFLADSATAIVKHDDYHKWLNLYEGLDNKSMRIMQQNMQNWQYKPLISIIMPTYNSNEKWLIAAIESVQGQIYPNWELCIADDASSLAQVRNILQRYQQTESRIKIKFREKNGHISAASNTALELASGEYVALLDHDDELTPHALYWVVAELQAYPNAQLIYSDEDKIDAQRHRFGAYFKSDWNPDLFLSHNLITHLAVYKRDLLINIGGFRLGFEGAQDYDLAIRAVENLDSSQIRHIPRILYHWRIHEDSTSANPDAKPYAINAAIKSIQEFLHRQNISAQVSESNIMTGMLRVQYNLPQLAPLVSIIIPTYNQLALLRQAVTSIINKTDYPNYELLIVDNRSDDAATLTYLAQLETEHKAKILRYEQEFNFSAINNFAVEQAQGSIIALLNNDVEIISRNWLSEMVSHAVRPDIGAVGAKLWYPHQSLQHAGVVLGVAGLAEHAHKGLPRGQNGYFGRAQIIQNFCAVTAACLVVSKDKFLAVGGLNAQHLAIAFNDIDLCLKLTSQGWRSLWTPYAELYHHESASRGYEDSAEKIARLQREDAYMRQQWPDWITQDPAYSPNLNHQTADFSLAFPPHNLSDKPMFSMKLPNFFRPQPVHPTANRANGYKLLTGHGLEIGALHEPASLPPSCTVEYCDANSRDELLAMFPELHDKNIVNPQHICNVDKQGLAIFADQSYDFVIFNHVIEHIANPIKMLGELFRVTKIGGYVVLSAPDKDYTYDQPRPLTSFAHLLQEYQQDVTEVTEEHYLEFMRYVEPSYYAAEQAEFQHFLARVKMRREHAHVWNSASFADFLQQSFTLLNLQPKLIYRSTAKENGFEFFSVWQR
jgi:glycosyltransferase involved in cell wall biosynthesis/SAM-dependent methyltransferase